MELTITKFNGRDRTKWIPFKESFIECVDNQPISKTKKFFYLRESLEGDAHELIADLEVSEENYSIAWSTLHDRYDNKRLTVHAYLSKKIDFPGQPQTTLLITKAYATPKKCK